MDQHVQGKNHNLLALIDPSVKADRNLFFGILHFCGTRGGWDVRSAGAAEKSDPLALRNFIRKWPVDGLVAAPSCEEVVRKCLSRIPQKNRPVTVLVDPEATSGADCVISVDDVLIGTSGARLLLSHKYKHFAYVGSIRTGEEQHSRIRAHAFAAEIRKAGMQCAVFAGEDRTVTSELSEMKKLGKFLQTLPKPAAVMVYCDTRAQQVLNVCYQFHLKVPEQIALVSVDNDVDLCESMMPSLTSLAPDFGKAGRRAAWLLDGILRSGRRPSKPLRHVYGVQMTVERASTQDVRGAARLAAATSEYIRLHARENLSVASIACMLHVSTRLLEMRFSEIYNHSVKDEIQAVRFSHVEKMLRERKCPLGDIAQACGFGTTANLCAQFRKRYGCTMRSWRLRENGQG